ncbi:hypothetical protein [Streptomyces niveus]|uniref:hypothetical protein n=1 Tax=Streptomyces niveus TaxID=193462 RepID=UPI003416A37F
MSDTNDRQATVGDLPGWATPDTIAGLAGRTDMWGWITVGSPIPYEQEKMPPRLGRSLEGKLWVSSVGTFADRGPHTAAAEGNMALLVGVHDGIGLWIAPAAYHHIKPVDRSEANQAQPDVEPWLPIREILTEIPAVVRNRLNH